MSYDRDSQIRDQINVLNKDYSGIGVQWTLAGTDRTENPEWFDSTSPNGATQTAMKSALRKGGAGDLNVYSVGFVPPLLTSCQTDFFPFNSVKLLTVVNNC
jgi:hypothetical protein